MFVKLITAVLLFDPDEDDVIVMVCRAYEPPVTSVPAVDAVPNTVTNATFIGVVGAVYDAVPHEASNSRFASAATNTAIVATQLPNAT